MDLLLPPFMFFEFLATGVLDLSWTFSLHHDLSFLYHDLSSLLRLILVSRRRHPILHSFSATLFYSLMNADNILLTPD